MMQPILYYTVDSIRSAVKLDEDRLFSSWSAGRPIGWTCDQQTKDSVCIDSWISEEIDRLIADGFTGPDGVAISEDDRRIQQLTFNRWCRSRDDLFELAAEIMNDVVDGKILRERVPHKRWG